MNTSLKTYSPLAYKHHLYSKDDIFLHWIQKEDEANHPYIEVPLPKYVKPQCLDKRMKIISKLLP